MLGAEWHFDAGDDEGKKDQYYGEEAVTHSPQMLPLSVTRFQKTGKNRNRCCCCCWEQTGSRADGARTASRR